MKLQVDPISLIRLTLPPLSLLASTVRQLRREGGTPLILQDLSPASSLATRPVPPRPKGWPWYVRLVEAGRELVQASPRQPNLGRLQTWLDLQLGRP